MSSFFPVPPSPVIAGLEWCSDLWTYPDLGIGGDTYPLTWTADGNLIAASGDPNYGDSYDGLDVIRLDGTPPSVTLTQLNPMRDWTGHGGWGVKPTGMIAVDGTLVMAVQNLLGWRPPVRGRSSQHGSDATLIASTNGGHTWSPRRDEAKVLFPGPRFGGPAFLNLGQDHRGAQDEFVYAVSSDHWDNGSELRLGRVPRERILDADAWQWVEAFGPGGAPVWSRWLNDAIPLILAPRTLSCPDFAYVSALRRYLVITWCFHQDFDTRLGTDLIIYDAPTPWGPYTLAHYEREWLGRHVGPYCPRLPLKWMDADGLGGWMLTSGNFQVEVDPARPFYRPNAQRFRFRLR